MAVVGAGISGLACARALREGGLRVRVLDKSRGAGGRMSTRRARGWRFDHGAQYFTVRDWRFASRVESWRRQGVVAKWPGEIAVIESGVARGRSGDIERWVGVPGMSAVCRALADGLDVDYDAPVERLEPCDDGWRLASAAEDELCRAAAVVVSAPAPQAAALLERVAPHLAARAGSVSFSPCWAAMAGFDEPLGAGFDGAFVHDGPLGWIARDGSKPGRTGGESWVLHGSPEWSARHLEVTPEEAADTLLRAFAPLVGGSSPRPVHLAAHRWRFALPEALPDPCLFDGELRLAACGDWCGGPRVEGAFLSGLAAAERLLAR